MPVSNNSSYYFDDQPVNRIYRGNRLQYIKFWEIGIQTTGTNQTFGITLNGTSPNITVDWGDGTFETFTTTGNKIRTYTTTGNYTIKISGSFSANGNIRLGTTNSERSRVQSTSVIPTIPGLTSFANCFNRCNSLTSIPSGLFDNNTAVTSFASCFENCSSLTSIPSGLFDNNTAVTSFASCFAFCGSLSSIPSGLFDNNTAVTSFASCFSLCSSLSSIPSGLFDNNTAVTAFNSCFATCGSLATVPSGLFANNTAVTSFVYCFASCGSLTTVPSGLFANNIAVTDFSFCFSNIALTTTSYSNLLINMASNAASRQNNVPFDGGNSKYNLDGQTARNTLIAKSWSFTDGGLE